LARGEQLIEPTETAQDTLADLAIDALIVGQQQVGAVGVGLSAQELRNLASSSLSKPVRRRVLD
jgi:hypothetical protein